MASSPAATSRSADVEVDRLFDPPVPGVAGGGAALFQTRPGVDLRLKGDSASAPEKGATRSLLDPLPLRADAKEKPEAPGGLPERHHPAFDAKVTEEGEVRIEDHPFTLDLTDAIMRLYGMDPYGVEKRKFWAQTREQRFALARKAARAHERAALRSLASTLEALWNDGRRPAVERRNLVFQLWDECVEGGDRPGDAGDGGGAGDEAETLLAGRAARDAILSFVRQKRVENPRDGYPETELEALNRARQSRERFEPYGQLPRDDP